MKGQCDKIFFLFYDENNKKYSAFKDTKDISDILNNYIVQKANYTVREPTAEIECKHASKLR